MAPLVLGSGCLITCPYSPILGHTAYMAAPPLLWVLNDMIHSPPSPPPKPLPSPFHLHAAEGTGFVEVGLDGVGSDCHRRHGCASTPPPTGRIPFAAPHVLSFGFSSHWQPKRRGTGLRSVPRSAVNWAVAVLCSLAPHGWDRRGGQAVEGNAPLTLVASGSGVLSRTTPWSVSFSKLSSQR